MMRAALLLAVLSCAVPLQGQLLSAVGMDTVRTHSDLQKALQEPDKVLRLDLSSGKWRTLPEDVRRFTNLNALVLDRNKLKDLPEWLAELQYLQELSLHRNKLEDFPEVICSLPHLKRLTMSRNALRGLPACMGRLDQLVSLDLWSNELDEFPDELAGMTALRFMDLRVIQFTPPEVERITELLPWAKIHFSAPCNCGM